MSGSSDKGGIYVNQIMGNGEVPIAVIGDNKITRVDQMNVSFEPSFLGAHLFGGTNNLQFCFRHTTSDRWNHRIIYSS